MLRAFRWFCIALLSSTFTSACGGTIVEDARAENAGGSAGSGGSGGYGGSGASGGTSTGGSGGMILDGGPNLEAGIHPDVVCSASYYPAEPIPRGMMVLVDRSVSMMDENKWDAVREGLLGFAASSNTDGLSLAIRSFPAAPTATIPTTCTSDVDCGLYGPCLPGASGCAGSYSPNASCDPLDYAPELPFATLPDAFPTIESTVQGLTADGDSTPTTPALEGAATHAEGFSPTPDALADLVLLTDGEPIGCTTNSVAFAAAIASDALASPRPIRTFVIAVGADPAMAEEIASAGGTAPASMVSPGPDAAQAVQSALEAAYQSTCAFRLPPFEDPNELYAVNMVIQESGDEETLVYNVGSAAGCNEFDELGWYYDDPASPSRIEFCPDACALARQPSFEVSIIVACLTLESP
jgi:hypothetical protein